MEGPDRVVARIGEYPDGGAPYFEGTRRYLMQRFPFSVVYRKKQRTYEIVAVAHAEGNLATGRTASRAEERATWPANQRLERTAEKRGRSAAGRWAASVGPLKRNHIRAAFSVSRSKRDRLLLHAHIPVQLRLDRLFARTSCLQKEDVCSSHSLFRAFYSKRRES